MQPLSVKDNRHHKVVDAAVKSGPEPFARPIYVTRPTLPPLEDIVVQLKSIWSTQVLSNQGPKHDELAQKLQDTLRAKNLELFCNGTLALTIALKALGIKGEVITTPFTFPATPHSITWAGATPVFCDINSATLCLDADQIEELISPRTEAIVGVHVYGVPCNVDQIEKLARKHGLKVIYDAAHAFMTEVTGRPIGSFGDVCMFSFHATKLFHTVEGGCLTYQDPSLGDRLRLLRNFGIRNEEVVDAAGLNAKLNELQCAVGIEMLRQLPNERARRKELRRYYLEALSTVPGISPVRIPEGVNDSLQYMAVRVNAELFGMTRDELYTRLKRYNVFARKYFFPLCSEYACYGAVRTGDLRHAKAASAEILCVPFYGQLSTDTLGRIIEILLYIHHNAAASSCIRR